MYETIQRIGLARNAVLGVVLYHRLVVKQSTKFRVFPVPGDIRSFDLDPTEWAEKYEVVSEHKTTEAGSPA